MSPTYFDCIPQHFPHINHIIVYWVGVKENYSNYVQILRFEIKPAPCCKRLKWAGSLLVIYKQYQYIIYPISCEEEILYIIRTIRYTMTL